MSDTDNPRDALKDLLTLEAFTAAKYEAFVRAAHQAGLQRRAAKAKANAKEPSLVPIAYNGADLTASPWNVVPTAKQIRERLITEPDLDAGALADSLLHRLGVA